MENDYIMETNELEFNQTEIFYNCTECSSAIEMLSINENECTIEFQCINNKHRKKMLINEYLTKMKKYNDKNINNDMCNMHNKKYECYCIDCNIHLCKDCLKLRNHVNHLKNNIIEIQPEKKELNIYEKIIKNYEDKINNLEKDKIQNTKELNFKYKIYKNKIKKGKYIKLNESKTKKEIELNNAKDEYLNNIKNIIKKLDKEIKMMKYNYELKINEINNKYKLMVEYNNIIYNNKIEKLDLEYIKKIKKFDYENKIENLNDIKRLNSIIYNSYDNYNNNYYNSINIQNILINYKNNETNNEINKELNNVYENMIKVKQKNNKMYEYKDEIKNIILYMPDEVMEIKAKGIKNIIDKFFIFNKEMFKAI